MLQKGFAHYARFARGRSHIIMVGTTRTDSYKFLPVVNIQRLPPTAADSDSIHQAQRDNSLIHSPLEAWGRGYKATSACILKCACADTTLTL